MIDLSSVPGSVPVAFLRRLTDAVDEFVLVGALARDLQLVGRAGSPPLRATRDVDITVYATSVEDLEARTGGLESARTLQTFFLDEVQVDVLARGPIAPDGVLEVTPGVTCDVTGMAEAARCAETFRLAEDLLVRVPTLASLVGLKIVAWGARSGTTSKDAQDLAALLDGSHRGEFEDRCWQEGPEAGRWEYDPASVGPALVASELLRTWSTQSLEKVRTILEAHRAALTGACSRHAARTQPVEGQLDVLRRELDRGVDGGDGQS